MSPRHGEVWLVDMGMAAKTRPGVVEEIKRLPPSEQAEVIRFTCEVARTRQLTPSELGELAERLAETDDPAEISRLKSALTRGFYGE